MVPLHQHSTRLVRDMPYRVIKDNQAIAVCGRVVIESGGVLECREEFGAPIKLLLAPGQWDSVYWVDDE